MRHSEYFKYVVARYRCQAEQRQWIEEVELGWVNDTQANRPRLKVWASDARSAMIFRSGMNSVRYTSIIVALLFAALAWCLPARAGAGGLEYQRCGDDREELYVSRERIRVDYQFASRRRASAGTDLECYKCSARHYLRREA
jgi:hypothetical protein